MAGELDFNAAGKANMLSVRQTPWHREGTVLPDHPAYEEAMRIAGLDYTVERRPAWFEAKTRGGRVVKKPAVGWIVVRTDTEQPIGLVGDRYIPIQNRDALAVLKPLVASGKAVIETAGVLRKGGDAWMLVKWNVTQMGSKAQGLFAAGVHPYGLVAANHTGRRGVLLKDTPVRVVCANTLGSAEHGGGVTVRHTTLGHERLQEAADALWGDAIERYEKIAVDYVRLKRTVITPPQFEACVPRVVAPWPNEQVSEVVARRLDRQWSSLTHLWSKGTGHVGDHSAWEAYMAATEALDHDPQGVFKTRGSRAKQLLDGHLARKKDQVLQELLALAV